MEMGERPQLCTGEKIQSLAYPAEGDMKDYSKPQATRIENTDLLPLMQVPGYYHSLFVPFRSYGFHPGSFHWLYVGKPHALSSFPCTHTCLHGKQGPKCWS